MSRYRKIEVRTWGDEKFCALSPMPPCGQGLWLYLITGPHTGQIPGLFRAGPAALAESLGWPEKAFREAFREVLTEGMLKADLKASLMWVPNAIKHNKPVSPNVVKSWADEFDLLPECPLKLEAYESIRMALEQLGEAYLRAFDEAIIKPSLKAFGKTSRKTCLNQEQEQEQEQEQDKIKTLCQIQLPDMDDFAAVEDFTPPVEQARPRVENKNKKIIREIFDHWREVMNHPSAVLDKKRERLISEALRWGYNRDQLCEAITGCSKTPHNVGDNDRGQRYDGLHIILKNADQIDRFRHNCHNPPAPVTKLQRQSAANIHAGQTWLEKRKQQEAQK